MVNDIILLKLDEDIELTENIQPACLPKDKDKTYHRGKAFVSGKCISEFFCLISLCQYEEINKP